MRIDLPSSSLGLKRASMDKTSISPDEYAAAVQVAPAPRSGWTSPTSQAMQHLLQFFPEDCLQTY